MYLRGYAIKPKLGLVVNENSDVALPGPRLNLGPITRAKTIQSIAASHAAAAGTALPVSEIPVVAPVIKPVVATPLQPAPIPVVTAQPPQSTSIPAAAATSVVQGNATAPITAGTPVPAGYPTNKFFAAPDGTIWQFNTNTNTWFVPAQVSTNPGTGAITYAGGATPPPNNAGTPVPVGYPTSTTYVASDGTQWVYNATTNAWVYGGSATGGSSSVPTTAGTAASVTAPAAATSDYQALLDWLSVSDTTALISSVPNWITALGAALLLYKVSQGKGKR